MNINLITNISGFPYGTAAAKRVKMIGKALIASGCNFNVYTNSLSYNKFNNAPTGSFEGIKYTYLHGTTDLNKGKIAKTLLYSKGIIKLFGILRKMDPASDIVYIDAQGTIFNVITILLCKMCKLKIFEEVNEWFHNELNRPLEKIINEGPMLKWVQGALVISQQINGTVLKINPNLKTIVIPVLEDSGDYLSMEYKEGEKYCFWMGQVDGYIEDVLFIIEAMALAYQKGERLDLIISGPCKLVTSKLRIKSKAEEVGFPVEKIKLLGYVSESDINRYCQNAFLFVIPMWQNERSASRFPTKMASFMFSGKPVLTCRVGEIGTLLTDNENVVFYKPGNAIELAQKIQMLSNDHELYKGICNKTKAFALANFNYKEYGTTLKQFCSEILHH